MLKMARLAGSCSLTLLALTGVASAEPRRPTHVACVGDSITAGSGASSAAKSYVSVLQGLLGNAVQVKNFGNSGSTMLTEGYGDKPYTKQVEYTNATNFVKDAGATSVVSVVIILGANDSKPQNWEPAGGKNDQQYLKDYRALVEHFAGLPTKPVIYLGYPLATGNNPCCSIRGNVIHDEQLPLIKQLAMEKHLPIIDLNTPTTGHPEYFGDGVHPNDAGYAVMAGLVKKGLEREPGVSIASPTAGALLPFGAAIPLVAEVMADAVDVTSVEFFAGANSFGKATTKPFTISLPGATGSYTITAKATDATLANATSAPVSFAVSAGGAGDTPGSGGVGGGGGAGGGEAAGGGGASTGGTAISGAGAGGVVATAGSAGSTAGAPSGSSGSGSVATPTTPTSTDEASCGCSTPGAGSNNAAAWLFVASALTLRALAGRRPASTPRPTAFRRRGRRGSRARA